VIQEGKRNTRGGKAAPGWGVGLLLWLCLAVLPAWAQDYAPHTPVRADSVSDAVADSILHQRDSVFYTQLKSRMYKRRITRQLYDLLFRDVYNSRAKTGEVSQVEVNPFRAFEGKIISEIHIRRLDVFGQSVYDTTRKAANWVEKIGNRLHADTREGVIRRSYLLFEKGDRINPQTLRDNERLLRSTNIFHDARILVVPHRDDPRYADLYVITQDVWSLTPSGGVSGPTRFDLTLDQRNFRGLGHTLANRIAYNGTDPVQKVNYRGRYVVPYIGRTFLTAQADVIHERDWKQFSAHLYRPFLTPDTRLAGSLEYSRVTVPRFRVFLPRTDSARVFPLAYTYCDGWIGYAFRPLVGFMDPDDRTRFIVAARVSTYTYFNRPSVRADTNQLFQHSRTSLFSLGVSPRRYRRDVLIYGFGRTEDVPYGSLAALVGGMDYAELGGRMYLGFKYSRAGYVRNLGYLYGLFNLGGFVRNGGIEQGITNVELNYFSPLRTTSWGNWRHFVNLRYAQGLNRFQGESLLLGNRERIGVTNDGLRGTRFLLTNLENVLFSKLDVLGFRVAVVTFATLGLVNYQDRRLLSGPIYQGYGLGLRLRNENLTFNSFQIRVAWYPNLPNNPSAIRFAFEGIPSLRFRDFDIAAPEIIPYR